MDKETKRLKMKEHGRRFYQEHKGIPVEHKEVPCIICNKPFIQKTKRIKVCNNPECRKTRNLAVWKVKERRIKRVAYKFERYDQNVDKVKAYSKNYSESHKEEKAKYSLEYYHKRYKEDVGFRNRRLLGTALGGVIRTYIQTGRITNPMKQYGIDWKGIIKVLTPIPQPRSKYHVDHIIPLYKFDLSNFEQIRLAFAPENHRWLLAPENLKRSKLKRIKNEI